MKVARTAASFKLPFSLEGRDGFQILPIVDFKRLHGLSFARGATRSFFFPLLSEDGFPLNRPIVDEQSEEIEAVVVSSQIMADFFVDDDRGVDVGVKDFFSAAVRAG